MKLQTASWALLTASAIALSGCAHEVNAADYPPSVGAGWVVPESYSWPPGAVFAPNATVKHASVPVGSLGPAQKDKSAASAPSSIFAKTLGDVPRPRARNELRSVLPGSAD